MDSVKPNHDERSRKNMSFVLQGISSVGQAAIAKELNISESTVSRHISEQLERSMKILAIVGGKSVPEYAKCYNPEYIEKIQYFAAIGIKYAPPETQSLEWD